MRSSWWEITFRDDHLLNHRSVLLDYGKNSYGHTGRTLDASVQVVIEKDSGNVYLYYFGDSGLTR